MYRNGLIVIKKTLKLNLLLLIVFLSLFSRQSDATFLLHLVRQFAAAAPSPLIQASPSPSPVAAAAPNSVVNFGNQSHFDVPKMINNTQHVDNETCDNMSTQCRNNSLAACVGLQGLFLRVLNDDDSSLKVNVTFLPSNITYKKMDISSHQAKKINISDNVRGSSSILIDTDSGGCTIHLGADVPKDHFNQLPSVDTYLTPINGVYVLLVSALIVGGAFTCFTLSKRKRHLDGVAYQELEMCHPELIPSVNVESAEGWDQDWDDDWDEEKAVKSPAGNHVTSGTTNGHSSSRSNKDGWENGWDDLVKL